MVTAVSNTYNAAAYLSQIKSGKSLPTASKPSTASSSTASSPSAKPSASPAASSTAATPTHLLGLSSDLLSLLQETSSSSANGGQLSTLFGSSSIASTDPLSGVYNVLLTQYSSISPLQKAVQVAQQQSQNSTATAANPLKSVLDSYNKALNANNQTLLKNAQSVLAANNGKLPTA